MNYNLLSNFVYVQFPNSAASPFITLASHNEKAYDRRADLVYYSFRLEKFKIKCFYLWRPKHLPTILVCLLHLLSRFFFCHKQIGDFTISKQGSRRHLLLIFVENCALITQIKPHTHGINIFSRTYSWT